MQSKESDSPSMCTTVRSTPLIAIESPSCVPLRMVPQRIRRRPRSASITAPTSSIMPVNMPSLAYRSREAGARKGTFEVRGTRYEIRCQRSVLARDEGSVIDVHLDGAAFEGDGGLDVIGETNVSGLRRLRLFGDLSHRAPVVFPHGTVVDVGALNVETRPLNDSGVLLERKLRFGAGQPAPFVAKGRGRFRPPDDVGGDHVRAAFSDACQLPKALLQTDDRGSAYAVGGVEHAGVYWKAAAIGTEDGYEVAEVEEPGFGDRVMDKRVVQLDGGDAAGEAARERRGGFALPAGDVEQDRVFIGADGLGDDLDGLGSAGGEVFLARVDAGEVRHGLSLQLRVESRWRRPIAEAVHTPPPTRPHRGGAWWPKRTWSSLRMTHSIRR